MGYKEELGRNGVEVADVFAEATDTLTDPVMVDAGIVLEYIAMIGSEIALLAVLEPENTEAYEAMARPVLLIGSALRAYVTLRSLEVPDDLEEVV